jgi:hypothetical protein
MAWVCVDLPRVTTSAIAMSLLACSPSAKNQGSGDDAEATANPDDSSSASADDDDDGDDGPVDDGDDDAPADDDNGDTTGNGDDDADDGPGFVLPPDGGAANECDPKVQDCPKGQKCTAWANDGGTFWNANRCVDASGDGVSGDVCQVEGSGVSGIDTCDVGFICMNTDEQGNGTCVKFCQGENEDCDPGDLCAIYNDGVLPICLVGCDPLLQDCPMGQGCIDTPNGQFICFTDASGAMGTDGDACPPEDGENSCDPGYWCGQGSTGCMDVNCCTAYCDLSGADTCVAPDECISFYGDPDSAPPEYVDVGVCALPR